MQHSGNFFRFFQPRLACLSIDIADVHAYIYLRTQFASGAFGIAEELRRFLARLPLMPFSNVREHREPGARDLIAESEIAQVGKALVDISAEPRCAPPDVQILKPLMA